MNYTTRFVHKVAGLLKEEGPVVSLTGADLADRRPLGAALRLSRVLIKGGSVQAYRVESNGRIVVFPTCPGLTTYWHSIILSPVSE